MSLVMKLWDPRQDDDLSSYDFHDIDESTGDDGLWGFENLDHDDPPGDPNNNALKADFDFGSAEDGVDPDSYVPDESSIDFEDLHRETEEEDPEFGEDDGLWGFQTLDNDDPPDYLNNNDLNAEFEIGDQDKDAGKVLPEESYIPDESECEFYDIDNINTTFDYGDIDEVTFPKHDSEALEYNFGEEDQNPYIIVPKYFMTRVVKNALQVLMHDGLINTKEIPMINPTIPWIEFQMYYNIETNKCFMEYRVSRKIALVCDIHNLESKINGFINANFKDDLGYIPEVITIDDQYKVCDNADALSPYVIGYWKSLTGQYKFLEDQTEIMQDMRQYRVINHGEEYQYAKDALYDNYTAELKQIDANYNTAYQELWQKYYEANKDDGLFGFQTLDNDDPIGTKYNNDLNADFDYGSAEDGVDPDSYIKDGTLTDFRNQDDLDNGEWSFQNLDNDDTNPEDEHNNNDLKADFDFGSLEEGIAQDTYIVDNYDYNFEVLMLDFEDIDYEGFKREVKTLRDNTNKAKSESFKTFLSNLEALKIEYDINPDQKPEKSMQDFIDIVVNIRKSYKQTSLTEEKRQAYIKDSMDIYVKYYNSNPALYKVKMSQLNTKYFIKEDLNKKIPDIYREFYNAYYKFFNRYLPEVNGFVIQRYMSVVNLASY